jgi:hypothetical protein
MLPMPVPSDIAGAMIRSPMIDNNRTVLKRNDAVPTPTSPA